MDCSWLFYGRVPLDFQSCQPSSKILHDVLWTIIKVNGHFSRTILEHRWVVVFFVLCRVLFSVAYLILMVSLWLSEVSQLEAQHFHWSILVMPRPRKIDPRGFSISGHKFATPPSPNLQKLLGTPEAVPSDAGDAGWKCLEWWHLDTYRPGATWMVQTKGGFYSHGGTPVAGWFIGGNPSINGWLRGTPISGNHHIMIWYDEKKTGMRWCLVRHIHAGKPGKPGKAGNLRKNVSEMYVGISQTNLPGFCKKWGYW